MKIKASEWSGHNKSVQFAIPTRSAVNILVCGQGSILVIASNQEEEVIISSGQDRLSLRAVLEGFHQLEISCKAFGMCAQVNGTQLTEPLDDRPLPARKVPNNLIGRMHDQARRQFRSDREAFENNTSRPGYEMDDDDVELFEEDEAQILVEQHQAKTQPKPKKGLKPDVVEEDSSDASESPDSDQE